MKTLILLALLFPSVIALSQSSYEINNIIWRFTKPTGYKTRVDNFLSARQAGDSIVKSNNSSAHAVEDQILFSLAKSDSSDMNIVLASYKSNANIVKLTLKGYVDKLIEFIKYNYEKLNSNVTTSIKEILIDGIKFYVIENKLYHKENNFTYWNEIFVGEIGGKELNITVVYDTEQDKNLVETAIQKSKFISH